MAKKIKVKNDTNQTKLVSTKTKESSKPKVAIRSITGCAGCQLEIYFIEDVLLEILDKIDLVAAPMIKEDNYEGYVDITFIEGSVTFNEDIENIKEWREKSKVVVGIGACACEGGVQQQKNFIDKERAEKYVYKGETKFLKSVDPTPISDHIKVDFELKGCPVDKQEFIWFLKQVLLSKTPKQYEKPVCHKCKLNENYCLLAQGRDCYGSITVGNCSVMCPDYNHPCTGCRGPISDGNFEELTKLLVDKGFEKELIISRMRKYGGIKMERIIKANIDAETTNPHKNKEKLDMLHIIKKLIMGDKK